LLKKSQFRETSTIVSRWCASDLPSLEERRDDIPLLVRHFLRRFNEKNALSATIDPAAVRHLQQRQWPATYANSRTP